MFSIEDPDGEKNPLPSSIDIQYIHLPYMDMAKAKQPCSPLKLFDIARAEGRPLYGAAPMVRYSKVNAK
jgi:hypothetical protein